MGRFQCNVSFQGRIQSKHFYEFSHPALLNHKTAHTHTHSFTEESTWHVALRSFIRSSRTWNPMRRGCCNGCAPRLLAWQGCIDVTGFKKAWGMVCWMVYIYILIYGFICGYIRQLGWQMGVPVNKMVGPMGNCLVVERWTVCTLV